MRYPGNDGDQDSDTSADNLWDVPLDSSNGFYQRPYFMYDSTVSDHTPPDSDHPSSDVGAIGRNGQDVRPGTPEPGPSQPPPEFYIPMISINVPSRRSQRRFNSRRTHPHWYGASSLSSRDSDTEPWDQIVQPIRVPARRTGFRSPNYPSRPSSPGSRIPRPIMSTGLIDFSDNEEPMANLTPRLLNETFSLTAQSNPDVSRFIQPSVYSPFTRPPHNSPTLEGPLAGFQPFQPAPPLPPILPPPLPAGPSTAALVSASTQTDLPPRPQADSPSTTSEAGELEFDDSSLLGEILYTRQAQAPDPPDVSVAVSPSVSLYSERPSSVESASSSTSLAGLSCRSRDRPLLDRDHYPDSTDSSDSSSSSSSSSAGDEEDRSTPTLEGTFAEDGELPGPSSAEPNPQTTELEAEIVVNNDVVIRNGRCRLSFDLLHTDDLTELLSQAVTLKLEQGNVIRLNVTPVPSNPTVRAVDSPRPIYRRLTRYLGGVVQSGHLKSVKFCEDLEKVDVLEEEECSESEAVTSLEELCAEYSSDSDADLSELADIEND